MNMMTEKSLFDIEYLIFRVALLFNTWQKLILKILRGKSDIKILR